MARRIASISSGVLTIRSAPKHASGGHGAPLGARAEQPLDVVVGGRRLDRQRSRPSRERARRAREGVLGLLPGMDFRDRRHAPEPIGLESRAEHERVAVAEEEERRQPLAAVEVDPRQVEEVRGRRRQDSVGGKAREANAHRLQAAGVNRGIEGHFRIVAEGPGESSVLSFQFSVRGIPGGLYVPLSGDLPLHVLDLFRVGAPPRRLGSESLFRVSERVIWMQIQKLD